ncbi:nucleotidyltransferase substrate binding protein [Actinobacillus arthritidis]|uniref:nucleotidyltransferase substrate binding protein n=1 Tax=Actinobacillus arthritidis TaxID=157339 RepID=UPI0024436BB3|nr:nucleotidyltransferase substrate binding protein [Actinobacillus arthritidis]WGE88920.1 nucleotidyltransferase substrate binding protein [Actinobacillus arthritidis]
MSLSVEHLQHTADTLEQAILRLTETDPKETVLYDLFRNATIKSFELSLETTGKLLRKVLKLYSGSPREIDRLVFNDLFRYANKHGLLDEVATERWLTYRANRNITAHDYGVVFAEETLTMLPHYLVDLRTLAGVMKEVFDASAD